MFCIGFRKKAKELYGKFDTYVEQHVEDALHITTNIHSFLNSTAAVLLTAIIPGDVDELVRKALVNSLAHSINVLGIVDACKDIHNADDKVVCFVEELKKKEPALQEAILNKLSALIAAKMDGNRHKQNLYDLWVQAKFSAQKKY